MSATSKQGLERVHEYRAAARRIVRGDLPPTDKRLALMRLAESARGEPELGQWCQGAVWTESRHFLATGEPFPPPPVANDPVEAACRRLASQGLVRCGECRRPLPTPLELDRWRQLRSVRIEELRRFEEAVS